ncbi:FAD-dependent oxidoreductase [uncultured Abiotrophia sp.]|uniref:NAD(P)/FAD-dependent oxidoreductase n=1 Tax=uncultured Abiotrophia sp. TaxID=316094 RepID=UPI002626262C|nr:FAD-dependent oxidoreductase [uncultured Abiotrophia sp.]
MKKNLAIIGGGIVGATAAYYALKEGHSVTLYEDGTGQATKAAAGIICPWFTLRRNKPWYYLVSQGAEFYRRFMADLAEDGLNTDLIFQEVGALLVRKDESSLTRDQERAQERRPASPSIGEVTSLSAQEAMDKFPLLETPYPASFISGGARLDGAALIQELHILIPKLGGKLIHGQAQLVADSGHQVSVLGPQKDTKSYDAILLACGAWLPHILEPLGYEVAICPQKGQLFSVYLPDWAGNTWPVVMPPGKFDIIPFQNGELVIGATHENDRGYDLSVEAERLAELQERASSMLPFLSEQVTYHQVKVGIRAYTPDYAVLVGPVPELNSVWAVSGLGSSGLTSGPFLGYQWVKHVSEGHCDLDQSLYPIESYIKKV